MHKIINKVLVIYPLLILLISCTEIIESSSSNHVVIDSSFISYSNDSDLEIPTIYSQVILNRDLLDLIDAVWVEIDNVNDETLIFLLNDSGLDGDIIAGNGEYSSAAHVDAIDNGIYSVTFYVLYKSGNLNSTISEETVSNILDIGLYTPQIHQVCMPDIYFTSQEVVDSFEVFLTASDLNGFTDIKSVVLEMKKLPGYEGNGQFQNGSCQYDSQIDSDYIEVASLSYVSNNILPESCGITLDDNQLVYKIGLSVDPYNGGPNCGPHGPVSFRYKITDYSNFTAYVDKDFFLCWYNGICQGDS